MPSAIESDGRLCHRGKPLTCDILSDALEGYKSSSDGGVGSMYRQPHSESIVEGDNSTTAVFINTIPGRKANTAGCVSIIIQRLLRPLGN